MADEQTKGENVETVELDDEVLEDVSGGVDPDSGNTYNINNEQ